MQTDPIGTKDDLNLYAYTYNDAVNRTDPTGASWDDFFTGVSLGNLEYHGVDISAGAASPEIQNQTHFAIGRWVGQGLASNANDGGAGRARRAAQPPVASATSKPKTVVVDRSKHPEAAAHVESAQASDKPAVLTVDRAGAAARRQEELRGTTPTPGKDRDEYPPAMFKEGGKDASVKSISPSDNRGAGASIARQCASVKDGDKVKVVCK